MRVSEERGTFFFKKYFYRPCTKNVPYFEIIDLNNGLITKKRFTHQSSESLSL